MLSTSEQTALVRKIAGRYARRVWWADRQELEQVGHLAIAEASRTFDPRVAACPFIGYAQRAVVLAMRRHLWSVSAPVSGGKHRPEKSMRGLYRTAIVSGEDPEEVGAVLRDESAGGEQLLDEVEWRRRVRERLTAVATSLGMAPLVNVMLEEASAAEVGRRYGISAERVVAMTSKLRAALSKDANLSYLFEHRKV